MVVREHAHKTTHITDGTPCAIRAGNGISVGPILLGTAKPVHILEPAVSVRRIVNMTALAVVDASVQR